MATCIVCKASFDHGGCCPRCNTDNRTWMQWVKNEPIEQGGLRGLLAFARPHFWLPFIIAGLSGFVGLIAAFTLWHDIRPGFRLLTVLVIPLGCLIALQGIYEERLAIREYGMLHSVKHRWRRGISLESITLFIPTIAMAIIVILPTVLAMMESLWVMIGWWVLVETPQLGAGWSERFLSVLPVVFLAAYVILPLSLTTSSSLMLAQNYAARLNRFLPSPIFLQDTRLTTVVRREAEIMLGRLDPDPPCQDDQRRNYEAMGYLQVNRLGVQGQLSLPANVGVSDPVECRLLPQYELWCQIANWVWDEMERTDKGGVVMKVARQEIYQLPEADDEGHVPGPRISYIVRADPWGHISEFKRAGE